MSFTLESGFSEAQGRRDTMEDAHVVFDDILAVENIGITSVPGSRVSFYGVYDGHGGVDAAKMVQDELHKNVVSKAAFAKGDIETAIQEGFAETDEHIVEKSNTDGWMNGSTGVVGVLVDSKLYIANVGDSEACLVSEVDGALKTEDLTTPHKASDASERKRIEELGGHVFFNRVFGALAVSRSFGDSKFKKPKTSQNFVSCEPAIKTAEITPAHKFLILACDGLWDVMNHDAAAKFASSKLAEGKHAKDIAADLVAEALRLKTEDNVTVLVVIFKRDGSAVEEPVMPQTPIVENTPAHEEQSKTEEQPDRKSVV